MSNSQPQKVETSTLPPLQEGKHRRRIGLISVVACFGGLLFGYDTGVTNGAERPMQAELGLSVIQLGVVLSSLVFAAAVGALIFGKVSDAFGRRTTIIVLSILFFVGTVLVVFSPGGPEVGTHSTLGFCILVLGRIMLGLAVGGASTVVPVYLAELAPFEIRGSISGRNEVAIVGGQMIAYIMNAIIGNVFGHIDGVWRIMFSICAVPAIFLFVGMLRMPESPRWLVEHDQRDKALQVMKSVRPETRAVAELDQILVVAAEEKEAERIGLRIILSDKALIRILLVGIGVAMAQQLTGINSILYYGQRILVEAGFSDNTALLANVAIGALNVIAGFIAIRNMDRIDRRKTFAIGLILTTICHILIATSSWILPEGNSVRPYLLLGLILCFTFCMNLFLNVAVWVYLAEIFPLHMRGFGYGVSVLFGWTANGFITLFVPQLIEAIHITGTFYLFAGVGVLALIFVITQVPETRGITLEQLEEDVVSGKIYNHQK